MRVGTHPHGERPGKKDPPVYVVEDILLENQYGGEVHARDASPKRVLGLRGRGNGRLGTHHENDGGH